MEPPKCIQNAMLTKDKKPFTYTPGGLDLSEIRSPRMARRIERNAAYEGVSTPPPQVDRPQFSPGSLPPSAMAAMQPQMHVQVFPTGPTPQLHSARGGVPPPPPPPGRGGPAPPPMQPLPTQKVLSADQQVVERPDMTKIIPDNPMAMLKKTGGPRVKNTLLDEMYREQIPHSRPQAAPQQNYMHPSTPPAAQQIRSPPIQNTPYQQQQNTFSPKSPPMQQEQQSWSPRSPPLQQQQQVWSPPIIERSEAPRDLAHAPPQSRSEPKNSNVGMIYIPPLNNQEQSRNAVSSATPQSPKPQTPGTPTLKEAPKPWQQKQQQQKPEQVPEWARRETNVISSPVAEEQHTPQSSPYQQQQPRWPQQPPSTNIPPQNYREAQRQQPSQQRVEPPQQRFEHPQQRFQPPQQRFEPQTQKYEPPQQQRYEPTQQRVSEPAQYRQQVIVPAGQLDPDSHPNAVFVSQPIVLQHPGSGYGPPVINRRENVTVSKQEGGNTVVIPIQMEGADSPNRNGAQRNFGRQQSGPNNNPTQSGSFRVIQKMTGTERDEPEFGVVTEHAPRYQQQFSQEQMRKMNLNNDQDLQNRFKQVPNDVGRHTPQVRNIPIQIEGGGAPPGQCYIPPSQQAPAEEPKKYTGSSIPSRSFKILQAMTAPDSCANAKDANETNFDYPYHGGTWAYPPAAYPMYNPPPPYWNPYYPPNSYEYYSTEHSNSDPEISTKSAKTSPQRFWGGEYPPPSITPAPDIDQKYLSARKTPVSFSRCSSTSELENINSRKTPVSFAMHPGRTTPVPGRKTPKSYTEPEIDSNRNTPLPYWYGYPPQDGGENQEGNYPFYPPYPPYYDPYYYSYYYGYPPMFSPLPYVYHNGEMEDVNGYSSMDEMSYYNKKLSKSNAEAKNDTITISSPDTLTTPTIETSVDFEKEVSSSDSDTDTEVAEQIPTRTPSSGGLKTIRSVPDINVYNDSEEDESERSEDDEENDSSDSQTSSVYDGDEGETVPHQLSVIFEVSERTETPRNTRECSVFSDCTTMEAKSDEETEDVDYTVDKRWISDNLMEIASRIQHRINARIQLDDLDLCSQTTDSNDHCQKIVNQDIHTAKEDTQREEDTEKGMPNFVDLFSGVKRPENFAYSCDKLELSKEKPIDSQPYEAEEVNDYCENNYSSNVKIEESKNDTNDDDVKKEVKDTDEKKSENPQKSEDAEVVSKDSSDSEDWWGVLGKDEDDLPVRKRYSYIQESEDDEEDTNLVENRSSEIPTTSKNLGNETEVQYESKENDQETTDEKTNSEVTIVKSDDENVTKLETNSAHSNPSNASSRKVSCEDTEESSSSESDDSDSSDDEEKEEKHDFNNNEQNSQEEETVVIPSIKDRIRALQESIAAKKKNLRVEEDVKVPEKIQTPLLEAGEPSKSKTVSAKSSVKSFDEISEEDSGVTDLSRHFSDNEEFPELRKMSKCQRASTHSRLFQLLQEECENEDDEEIGMDERKSQLSLPLNNSVNDRLAEELVQSMLKQKRGEIFRNMSLDKLHAAAKKILLEDSNGSDNIDTPSEGFSEFLSPLRNDTGNSTPQEFYGHYNEYMQYYDSWAQAAAVHDNYENIQSKALKSLQDALKPNLFANSSVKCPRVLSGKNVHSDLSKLVECPEESSSPSITVSGKILDDTKS